MLIHGSRKTFVNDLHTNPIVAMDINEGRKVMISKRTLNSINTDENPCTEDETLSRTECLLKEVLSTKTIAHSHFFVVLLWEGLQVVMLPSTCSLGARSMLGVFSLLDARVLCQEQCSCSLGARG